MDLASSSSQLDASTVAETRVHSHRFNTGLFECALHPMSCLEACLCVHCLLGREYQMLHSRHLQESSRRIHVRFCSVMLMMDLFCCTLGQAAMFGSVVVRSLARERLHIWEDDGGVDEVCCRWGPLRNACSPPVWDCCTAAMCVPCSTAQVYRELSLRGLWHDALLEQDAAVVNGSGDAGWYCCEHEMCIGQHFSLGRDTLMMRVSAPRPPTMHARHTDELGAVPHDAIIGPPRLHSVGSLDRSPHALSSPVHSFRVSIRHEQQQQDDGDDGDHPSPSPPPNDARAFLYGSLSPAASVDVVPGHYVVLPPSSSFKKNRGDVLARESN